MSMLRALLVLSLLSYQANAAVVPASDPHTSVMWSAMQDRFFNSGPVVFDQRVKVLAPAAAEDQFNVPVLIDASALDGVTTIVAVADLNPIPQILELRPRQALPFVGFRVKLQQSTPIHVGVRTADGIWHIGSTYVDAAGGGCTAPAMAHGVSNWMDTLGITRAISVRDQDGSARMTLKMKHPMDTGLADGIPAFYLNELQVRDENDGVIADISLFEPVSEDPTLSLKPVVSAAATKLRVSARDTEGNEYRFELNVPAAEESR